uniref:Lcl C-terminal domain-containing protein n=1 Tax=Thiomicrospira microaerophila TaxID=406020 RepID=UPI0005C8E309
EQYSSKSQLAPATDLYALGGTLYKCLTAQTPEEATSRVIDDEHIPISHLPIAKQCSPGLVTLIDQCMQIKQKDRPAHAKDAKLILDKASYQKNITQKDYSGLELMIEMAGSDGLITQKETDFILKKAKQLQFQPDEVQSLIRKIAQQNNWKIETDATLGQPMQPPLQTNLIAERYIDNQDGTVTDIKTGLMWQRFSVGQRWSGNAVVGKAQIYNWITASNLGFHSGLRGFIIVDPDEHWKYATAFSSFNDWRLPTVDELHSIVYCSSGQQLERRLDLRGNTIIQKNKEALDGRCKGDFNRPAIVNQVFPSTPETFYWTLNKKLDGSPQPWCINFSIGSVFRDASNSYHVRLVRSVQ